MAKGDATIRLRMEGHSVVRSNLEELDRSLARSGRQMEQYAKQVRQMAAGGLDTSAMESKLVATTERINRLLRARSIEQGREMEALARKAATSTQADKQAEGKMMSAAYAMDAKLRAAEEKAYVAQEMRKIKLVEARTKAELKLEIEKQRNIDRIHAQAIRENLQMDREALRARTAAMAGPGSVGVHGRWQHGAYKTPAFGSMSDRFTAMFTVSNLMADITGDKSGAREIGLAASGFLLGSPLFATINAAAVGIGTYFRVVREESETAKAALNSYTNALADSANRWSAMVTGMAKSTEFGTALRKMSDEYGADILKTANERFKGDTSGNLLNDMMVAAEGMMVGQDQTGRERALKTWQANMDFAARERELVDKEQKKQFDLRFEQQRKMNLYAENLQALDAMKPGAEADRVKLAYKHEIEVAQFEQNAMRQRDQINFAIARADFVYKELSTRATSVAMEISNRSSDLSSWNLYSRATAAYNITSLGKELAVLNVQSAEAKRQLDNAKASVDTFLKQEKQDFVALKRRQAIARKVQDIQYVRKMDEFRGESAAVGIFGGSLLTSRNLQAGAIDKMPDDIADGVHTLKDLLEEVRKIVPVFTSN